MTDTLLPYYSRELTYIRSLAAEFARENPAMAERLGLPETPDEAKDPHIERLIEAFAYLTGRIRRKLDDDFPEIISGLMDVLYPHYQAPLPSMAIAQIALIPTQTQLTAGHTVPAGAEMETGVLAGPAAGEKCVYRTAYPVTLFPIEVASAQLGILPFSAAEPVPAGAVASLKIALRCLGKGMTFSKLSLKTVRLFIAAEDQHAMPLYELIFNRTIDLAIKFPATDAAQIMLGRAALKEVGFSQDEALLPFTPRSFPGYRLLTEYFAFPRKFLFLDIDLSPERLTSAGNQIELHLFFSERASTDLEKIVAADTFRLGCTPIVNLFAKRADQIELDETRTEYRVVVDRRHALANEVYSVNAVSVTNRGGKPMECRPFFSFNHRVTSNGTPELFWCARRRLPRRDRQANPGTEVYLSLVDLGFQPLDPGDRVISAEVTCLNRELPSQLSWGGGEPKMRLTAGGPVSVDCLTRPTHTLRIEPGLGSLWRLVSHLSLNHLSLGYSAAAPQAQREQAAESLREILRLYDFTGSPEIKAKIASVLAMTSQRVTRRFGGTAAGGACRGMQVSVQFDEDRFADRGLYLFACIIERFLALYCSVNSFVEMIAVKKQPNIVLRHWAPRAGEQVLI